MTSSHGPVPRRDLPRVAARALRAAARSLQHLARTLGRQADRLSETAPHASVFQLTYPAHVAFELACDGDTAAMHVAGSAVARLAEAGVPLLLHPGPLPADPRVTNLAVWLGSIDGEGDTLVIENCI